MDSTYPLWGMDAKPFLHINFERFKSMPVEGDSW
jgi:hypothetical protein